MIHIYIYIYIYLYIIYIYIYIYMYKYICIYIISLEKKFIHVSQGFYKFTDLDFFSFFSIFSFFFFFFFDKCLFSLRKTVFFFLTSFENSLKFISNIFQETHNFLVLTDPVIICIYLRTIRNPSLQVLAAGKASLVSLKKCFS